MTADDRTQFLLAIADDKHFIGQQYAEWIGVAPFLEEDLAFCSIGQDELGHAAALYELLSEDSDAAIDALAFGRAAEDYRSSWFAEYVTSSWPEAIVRHWMFDAADKLRWELVANSSWQALRDLAVRVEREEVYHRLHANSLLDALFTDEVARDHILSAVATMAPMSLGLFDSVEGEAGVVASGVAEGFFSDQLAAYKSSAVDRFGEIEWGVAPEQRSRTQRSPGFGPLLARMREVIDFDPQATW